VRLVETWRTDFEMVRKASLGRGATATEGCILDRYIEDQDAIFVEAGNGQPLAIGREMNVLGSSEPAEGLGDTLAGCDGDNGAAES